MSEPKSFEDVVGGTSKAVSRAVPVVPPNPPATGLVKKLAEVMGAIERIRKAGRNEHFGFSYVKEADILDAVRSEIAKRSILVVPRIQEAKFTPVRLKSSEATMCTIDMHFDFVDGETGETMDVRMLGQATDTGTQDKSFYKALSGATKYVLMKVFLISSGDDPEQTEGERAPEQQTKGKAKPPSPWEQIWAIGVAFGLDEPRIKAVLKSELKRTKPKEIVAADVPAFLFCVARSALNTATTEEQLAAVAAKIKQQRMEEVLDKKQQDSLFATYKQQMASLPTSATEPGSEG